MFLDIDPFFQTPHCTARDIHHQSRGSDSTRPADQSPCPPKPLHRAPRLDPYTHHSAACPELDRSASIPNLKHRDFYRRSTPSPLPIPQRGVLPSQGPAALDRFRCYLGIQVMLSEPLHPAIAAGSEHALGGTG